MDAIQKDFLKLQTCPKIKGDNCSYPAPKRGEIAEMAKQLDLPVSLLSDIFNNMNALNLRGGSAAESSDEEDPDDELYKQIQQDNIVNNIMLAISAFIAVGGLTTAVYNLSKIEQYLYNNGIIEPLCKGVLDRAMIHTLSSIHPSLGGSDCTARLTAAQEFIKKIAAWLVTAQGTLTYANWNTGHKLLKDKLFGSVKDQKLKAKQEAKQKTKKRAKEKSRAQSNSSRRHVRSNSKSRSRSNSKSRSRSRSNSKSRSRSRSNSKSRSRSKSKSRSRSRSKSKSRSRSKSKSRSR